jgi:hypothetical protein
VGERAPTMQKVGDEHASRWTLWFEPEVHREFAERRRRARPVAADARVCAHWLRDACWHGDRCDHLHRYDERRLPMCDHRFTGCYNEQCRNRHEPIAEARPLCPWYARGFCRRGARCRREHRFTRLCPAYALGFCADGPRCPLTHLRWSASVNEPPAGPRHL